MTQRRHFVPSVRDRAIASHRSRGWRAMAAEELQLIGAWCSSRISQGFEWFLQLGLPTAATILEMQNMKRRIPEIGEIDQAVRSLHNAAGPSSRASDLRPRPLSD